MPKAAAYRNYKIKGESLSFSKVNEYPLKKEEIAKEKANALKLMKEIDEETHYKFKYYFRTVQIMFRVKALNKRLPLDRYNLYMGRIRG